jgi:hypothetical protein
LQYWVVALHDTGPPEEVLPEDDDAAVDDDDDAAVEEDDDDAEVEDDAAELDVVVVVEDDAALLAAVEDEDAGPLVDDELGPAVAEPPVLDELAGAPPWPDELDVNETHDVLEPPIPVVVWLPVPLAVVVGLPPFPTPPLTHPFAIMGPANAMPATGTRYQVFMSPPATRLERLQETPVFYPRQGLKMCHEVT